MTNYLETEMKKEIVKKKKNEKKTTSIRWDRNWLYEVGKIADSIRINCLLACAHGTEQKRGSSWPARS